MNELTKVFNNSEFGRLRTLTDDKGELWFVAVDVCNALGYKNSRQAVKDNCKEYGVRITYTIDAMNRQQSTQVINEANLYRLILKSRLSAAEKFERWVMEEVLPSIRKTGTYTLTEKQQQATNTLYIEMVNDSIDVGKFAKYYTAEYNEPIGRNRVFEILRDCGYLMRNKSHWNEPYQKYIDSGKLVYTVTRTQTGEVSTIVLIPKKAVEYFFDVVHNANTLRIATSTIKPYKLF